jgi:hypothetical protein
MAFSMRDWPAPSWGGVCCWEGIFEYWVVFGWDGNVSLWDVDDEEKIGV